MLQAILTTLDRPWVTGSLLVILTLLISLQSIYLGPKTFHDDVEYTHFNNFKIFKASYQHLIANEDLYRAYPEEHWDYFKYSPTFALLMAPFGLLPDGLGLFLWNLVNVLVLFIAIQNLPLGAIARSGMLAIIMVELITTTQNAQSNALIAGLLLFALVLLERRKTCAACLCIVSTAFIKLFGVVALMLLLFYPQKLKAAAYALGWTLTLLVLPLIAIPADQLYLQYTSWLQLLSDDHSVSVGYSVLGWLQTWFGREVAKRTVLIVGAGLLLLPTIRSQAFDQMTFRLRYLASILIWVVIFNHKAESATFIIAVTGVVLWFVIGSRTIWDVCLLVLALLFTVLSPTEIFPEVIRMKYVEPYVLKVVPCILIWFKLLVDLLAFSPADVRGGVSRL